MVRKQSYKTYRTQKGCRKVNQAAFNRTDGKTDVNGSSPQEPRLCHRRRASALCGNPSARGAPLALAGHRPCRKLRYNTFPLQQDWRSAPCGNLPTLENDIVAFASGGLRARGLPPELAAPWKLIRDASGFRESGYRTFYAIRMRRTTPSFSATCRDCR